MPQKLNGHSHKRLSADDARALRRFVHQTLDSLPEDPAPTQPLAELLEQNSSLYREAVSLLYLGHSTKSVALSTGLPEPLVRSMTVHIAGYFNIVRGSTAANLAQASLRLSELMLEKCDDLPPDRLAFATSIAVEKAALLGGGATARIESKRVISREELQAMFDALPSAKVPDVKLIEEPPQSPQ